MGITAYGCEPDEAALFRSLAHRLGVLPTITEAPASERNAVLALGNRCVSVGHRAEVTRSTLRALSEAGVSYLSTRSVGDDHIDVDYAASVGIRVGAVTYSPDGVADYTLMLMLMTVRHAAPGIRRTEADDCRSPELRGRELRGRELRDLTVGVIGAGRIGRAVMQRLRGFGCRTLACDTRPQASANHVALDELLARSDVVTLHVPLTAGTHHLLDCRRLAQTKRGAVIVNTARGALIDTEALVSALENGRLGGAALDVLEGEEAIFHAHRGETPIESRLLLRLRALANVIVTPHIAYRTEHALAEMVEQSIVNCLAAEGARQHAH